MLQGEAALVCRDASLDLVDFPSARPHFSTQSHLGLPAAPAIFCSGFERHAADMGASRRNVALAVLIEVNKVSASNGFNLCGRQSFVADVRTA